MRKLKWLILVMCLVLGLSVFVVACGDDKGGDTNTTVEATEVSLTSQCNLEIGQSRVLAAVLTPEETNAAITWTSSDPTVVTVSTEGQRYGAAKFEGKAAGEANVTVSVSGKTATCKVTVTEHQYTYFYIRGESKAGLFDWVSLHRAGIDDAGARVLSAADLEDEYVLSTTIDLYKGDHFKFCQVMEAKDGAEDNGNVGWGNQIGSLKDDDIEEKVYTMYATATEATTLGCTEVGASGDPPHFYVEADGKYLITLDVEDRSAPVLTYKYVGEAAEIIPTVFDLYVKGNYASADWKHPLKIAEGLTEGSLTANFTVKYVGEAASDFGLLTVATGKDASVGDNTIGYARNDIDGALNLTGVTGITDGDSNWAIAAGVYSFNVTLGADGKFTAVTVTSGATETDKTIVITKSDSYDIRIKGGYVAGWAVSSVCATGLKGDNLTATFTVKYQGTEQQFGLYTCYNPYDEQAEWFNNEDLTKASTADGVDVSGTGNMVFKAAGTYTFTVVIDATGKFVSISVADADTEEATVILPPVAD